MGDQEEWIFLADDVGRLIHILQGLPRMSEVWKRAKSSCVNHESHNQVVAVLEDGELT